VYLLCVCVCVCVSVHFLILICCVTLPSSFVQSHAFNASLSLRLGKWTPIHSRITWKFIKYLEFPQGGKTALIYDSWVKATGINSEIQFWCWLECVIPSKGSKDRGEKRRRELELRMTSLQAQARALYRALHRELTLQVSIPSKLNCHVYFNRSWDTEIGSRNLHRISLYRYPAIIHFTIIYVQSSPPKKHSLSDG
jgi:hypothetical protein